jgi:hypothetical protein
MAASKPEPALTGAAFLAAYRKAKAARARDKRNQRGKRPPSAITCYRVDPGRN